MWSYVSPEDRVPSDHPLRPIREMVNGILKEMSGDFGRLYAKNGRPSIPPEQLLRALLLQLFFSVRSERQLMEQLDYNLLFRWFVGLNLDDRIWSATTFSKNRERLLSGESAEKFFRRVLAEAEKAGLVSEEHFTVDGTLIDAWAGQKSFKPKDPDDDPGDGENFHGQKRKNDTHESTTDPEARLFRKGLGKESKLCFAGHVLMENRNGLVVDSELTAANGRSEREAGLRMARRLPAGGRVTIAGDKGYDQRDFVYGLRELGVTPHVAAKKRYGAIDGRTTRHAGYAVSQRKRKLVEKIFGWAKSVGGLRQTRFRGKARIGWMFRLALAAHNLVRIRNLTWEPTP